MNRFTIPALSARLPALIAVLVALLLGSQVLGSVKAANLDMQAAHQTHVHQADASHGDLDDPSSPDMGCDTGACCADSCGQVGLSSAQPLQVAPGRHRPNLSLTTVAASRLGAIYRPPRPRV